MEIQLELNQQNENLFLLPTKLTQYDHNFLFLSISPLIKTIFKLQNQIENDQVKYYVTQNTCVEPLISQINEYISNQKNKYQPSKLLIQLSGGNLIKGFVYYSLNSGLYLILIQLLNIVTKDFQDHDTQNKLQNIFILLSMIILSFLSTYLNIKSDWSIQVWKTQIKIAIQYLLVLKALKTKQFVSKNDEQKKDKKINDEDVDIINLMTIDTEVVLGIQWGLTRGIASIITIIVALVMMEKQIGSAINNGIFKFLTIFLGITILGGSYIYNLFLIIIIQKCFEQMLKQKDNRISLQTDIIDGMKSIKYLCWEQIFDKKITDIRKKEYFSLTMIRIFDGFLAWFWSCLNYILLFVFLISYINLQKITNINQGDANIFAIIALFGILMFPLTIVPWAFTNLYKAYCSYNRIFKYLNEKEIDEKDIKKYEDYNFIKQTELQSQNIIIIKNMIFKWPVRSQLQLIRKSEDIEKDFKLNIENLEIQYKSITFLIGKLGSGKTALLYSIINEMENNYQLNESQQNIITNKPSVQPGIEVRGSIALVTQNHWLQNASIMNNILFGLPFNETWYNSCIQACQLVEDFSLFPNKDLTTVSANGGNLSGGQKQRISIARAVYSNRDIYLFDDIFSSPDGLVADAIFDQVILGLLIQNKKTVILVTSHYKYLTQVIDAKIILLENGNQVTDVNTFESYLKQNHIIHENQQYKYIEKPQSLIELNDFKIKNKQKNEENINKKTEKIGLNNFQEGIDQEYRDQGKISKKTFLVYFKAGKQSVFVLLLVFTVLMQASRVIIDFWLRSEISKYPNQIFVTLDSWFSNDFTQIFSYLILINVCVTFVRVSAYVIFASFAAYILFKKLNSSIMYSNMKFFDHNPCGRILNRLSSDVLVIDDQLPWSIHIMLETLVQCLGFPIGVAIYFPWMGIIMLLGVFMMIKAIQLYRPSNREIKRLQSVNDGKLISTLGEVCKGLPIIRAFKNEEWIIKYYIEKLSDSIDTWVLTTAVFIWLEVRILLISNVFFISTILTCIIIYGFELIKDYSTLSITMTYSLLSLSSFNDLMLFLCNCEQKFVSVERINQYQLLNEQEKMNDVSNLQLSILKKQEIASDLNQIQENLVQYSIVFQDVCLTYDDSNKSNKKYALQKFNLKIIKGEKIAIIGRTGSGKSSILNALFKLYEIEDGQIYIEQNDIRSLTLQELRSQMSIIPQFGFLYKASLKDNIDPSNQKNYQEVQKIIQESSLNITKQINKNKEEKNKDQKQNQEEQIIDSTYMIENSGSNFSNGEKQIINYYRILMKPNKIICLDEATSNMDPKSDETLYENLFKYCGGKTLIVITHRMENIDKFDRIAVIINGQITEIGKPEVVMNIEGGYFSKQNI